MSLEGGRGGRGGGEGVREEGGREEGRGGMTVIHIILMDHNNNDVTYYIIT